MVAEADGYSFPSGTDGSDLVDAVALDPSAAAASDSYDSAVGCKGLVEVSDFGGVCGAEGCS